MNCEEFLPTVGLAFEPTGTAAERAACMKHIAECEACMAVAVAGYEECRLKRTPQRVMDLVQEGLAQQLRDQQDPEIRDMLRGVR